MLRLVIPLSPEAWDEEKEEFVIPKTQVLQLEHSLISLSKWESKWCKAFLTKREKTIEETLDYIQCMTITQGVDPEVYNRVTSSDIQRVNAYIEAPMTATYFPERSGPGKTSNDVITSELIYYWMITLNIPFECQKWHLNRLLTLIHVCNIKSQPDKKISPQEAARQRAALNAARRKQHNSKG